MLKLNTMLEVSFNRRMIQRDTNDQYRFESSIFRGMKSKDSTKRKKKENEKKKEKKIREERLGIRVLLKYKNNLNFTLKPIGRPVYKQKEESLRRNKSRNKNFCSIFKPSEKAFLKIKKKINKHKTREKPFEVRAAK